MFRNRRLKVVASLGLLGLVAAWAHEAGAAEARRVSVWEVGGRSLPAKLRARVPSEVAAVVEKADTWQVVAPNKTQERALRSTERRCRPTGSAKCAQDVGRQLDVPFVLIAQFSAVKTTVSMRISLVDVPSGKTKASVEGPLKAKTWRDDTVTIVRKLLDDPALAPPPSASSEPVATAPESSPPPDEPSEATNAADTQPTETKPDTSGTTAAATTPPGGSNATDLSMLAIEPIVKEEQPPAAEPASEGRAAEKQAAGGTVDGGPSPGGGDSSKGLAMSVAAGPVFLLPNAKVHVTGGATVDFLYFLPLFDKPQMHRLLGVSVETGWYPMFGHGSNDFQEFDNFSELDAGGAGPAYVTTTFEVDWNIQIVPVYIGAVGRLSTDMLLALLGMDELPLAPEIFGRVGGAAAYARATATLRRPGEEPFAKDNTASDFAWGFYWGVGAGVSLGPGSLTAEYRYTNVRLNFNFPEWNFELGDIGGNIWRVGYRMDF